MKSSASELGLRKHQHNKSRICDAHTIVENLHAASHFRHETFSVLQYAMDFGTISKESLKRITKWKASYFTHHASYYPVPQTGMPISASKLMTLLPAGSIPVKRRKSP